MNGQHIGVHRHCTSYHDGCRKLYYYLIYCAYKYLNPNKFYSCMCKQSTTLIAKRYISLGVANGNNQFGKAVNLSAFT